MSVSALIDALEVDGFGGVISPWLAILALA
jgi:hypothetical protein